MESPIHGKCLVLLSGGLDSLCCALLLQNQFAVIEGLYVNFGQPAATAEIQHAEKIAQWLGIHLSIIELHTNKISSFHPGEIIGRNLFLISAALLHKSSTTTSIALGIHSGTQYYDCGPEFFNKANNIIREYTDGRCHLLAPLLNWTKSDIVEYAVNSQIPFDMTYSCELGTFGGCGNCLSCCDRRIYC